MRDFREGFLFWWRGWAFIFSHARLLTLAILPALLALGFAIAFVWILWTHLGLWVQQLVGTVLGLASGGWWYALAYYPLLIGGGLLVFLSSLYIAFLLHAGLAVPFYSALAEQTLRLCGRPVVSSWSGLWRLFRTSLLKTGLLLVIGVILFILSFVPVINALAMAGALLIMAFDCLDYSFDCQGLSLHERLGYLLRQRAQWLGMAAGLALTLLLPGLTLLVIPGAVVGGALILKERE